MTDEQWQPQWCLTATLLPYPYRPSGPQGHLRSQKIFPAGAKLYVIGGFAGMGYETMTVVGYAHGRRSPVCAHLKTRYLGGWRARLVYSPTVLRAIRAAQLEHPYATDRWQVDFRDGRYITYEPTDPAYGEHLARIAAGMQRSRHGPPVPPSGEQ